MNQTVINFAEKLTKFTAQWSPKIVAQMNDYHFKVVKLQGDFVWHSHADTDETFIVLEGELGVDFKDGPVALKKGEMVVIPKGVEHKPYARAECHVLLVEPTGTRNTGDTGGDRTVEPEWI
jgi:mannose-6-phosphate isomerase-like protein (cupin superfamily)